MFFLSQTENPFQYMKEFDALWYVLFGAVVVCAILVFILRPIHKFYTDKKTEAIIKESGAAEHDDGPDGDEGSELKEGDD